MVIIGIDPGLVKTGYGIISIKNEKPKLIDFGIISPNPNDTISNRIFTIFSESVTSLPLTENRTPLARVGLKRAPTPPRSVLLRF